MSSKNLFHLIADPPASGAWNMAVDEALLESAAAAKVPTLRIYRWESPTLSLGYFQEYEARDSHPESMDVAVVRRQSGGGAILHDQEITYSLAVPGNHQLARVPQELYRTVHDALVKWLGEYLSDQAELRPATVEGTIKTESRSDEPFLCFERRSQGDVVMVKPNDPIDHKVVGSAQRRRHGAVIQHGSILWQTSRFAQKICGFANISGTQTTLIDAEAELIERLPRLFGLAFDRIDLPKAKKSAALELQVKRYGQSAWTKRR